ncbi:MAG: hypothetical protein FJW98_04835 [Actinobacteria bacterium]|nr:hypothetical protein [Actinomycetota bacterium]
MHRLQIKSVSAATSLVVAMVSFVMAVALVGRDVLAAGETWTTTDTTGLVVDGSGIAYGNGSFVGTNCTTGTGNEFIRSANGTTWIGSGTATDICMTSVAFGNGKFVATSRYDRKIHVSSDGGATWTVIDPGAANSAEWTGITYGAGQFIAVSYFPGRKILRSTDAVTWTAIDADAASSMTNDTQWRDVAYGNGRFVGISHFARSLTSTDGVNWTLTSSLPVSAYDIAFGNGVFVAVSTVGTNRVMTSTDGVTWVARTLASPLSTTAWNDVTWDAFGDQFVAVGNSSVMTSPDGVTWTAGTAAASNNWTAVIAGASMLVAYSSNGTNNRIMKAGTYTYSGSSTTTPSSTTTTPSSTTTTPSSTTTTPSSTTTTVSPATTSTLSTSIAPVTTVVGVTSTSAAVTTTTLLSQTQIARVGTTTTVPRLSTSATTTSISPATTTSTSTTIARPVATAATPSTTTTVPEIAEAAPGEAAILVGGESVKSTLSRSNDQLVISAGDMAATISGLTSDGAVAPLDSEGNIRLSEGDQIQVEASGFAPNSDVEVWLFSTPTLLGTVTVNAEGTASAVFPLPRGAESGNHRVALNGKNVAGDDASFAVGIVIGSNSGGVSTAGKVLIAIPIALAVLFALVIPARRRRKVQLA